MILGSLDTMDIILTHVGGGIYMTLGMVVMQAIGVATIRHGMMIGIIPITDMVGVDLIIMDMDPIITAIVPITGAIMGMDGVPPW